MKKIHFIGLADVLKPKIIFEILDEQSWFSDKDCLYICEKSEGCVVDVCKRFGIDIFVLDKNLDYSKIPAGDVLVSLGWNKIIPEYFYTSYESAINCHGGYLPDYRGDRAYMPVYSNISDFYGVTVHFIERDLDSGPIVKQLKVKLFLEETPQVIHRRLSELSAFILPECIQLVSDGYKGEEQKGKARYFFKMTRVEMEQLRQDNIERMRAGKERKVAPHKEWEID